MRRDRKDWPAAGGPRFEVRKAGRDWYVHELGERPGDVVGSASFFGPNAEERAREYAAWKSGTPPVTSSHR